MRERDREVLVVEPEESSRLGWFIVGAALGAGLALLFAPASGRETRERLSRGALRLKDQAEELLDEMGEEVERVADDVEGRVDEFRTRVSGTARAVADEARRGKASVSAAREELERRLADARARRRGELREDEEPVA